MRRILVTGSRDWTDEVTIRDALKAWHAALSRDGEEVVLVHGAARGADRIAKKIWVEEMGLVDEPHPARWRQYGKAAGPMRNTEMVDLGADTCLGFPLEQSVGTFDCLDKAKAADIPISVYTERED